MNEKELDHLNRIVTMYLDYAEMQANSGRVMTMKDWVKKLDAFLRFNERDVLQNTGKVSHEVALALAEQEFDRFSRIQDQNYISDFDREVKKYLNQPKKDKKPNKNKV